MSSPVARRALDLALDELAGVVGRVVEHLDLQLLAGVVQVVDRAQQPLGDVAFVKNRQLHGDHRQFSKCATGCGHPRRFFRNR